MRSRRRVLPPALILAAGLAASGAWAAPDWRDARLSLGYRLTAGSDDYVGNAVLLRGDLRLTPLWSAYSKLDLANDRAYDKALAWTVGAQRDLPREWLAWAGVGIADASFQDGGGASSLRFETGAGRPIGRWWSDAEYRLISGKVGQVLPGGAQTAGSPSGRQAGMSTTQQMDHRGQPALSARSATGDAFTQNELTLFVGSPAFSAFKPVTLGFSASYWTRTDGPDGVSPYGSLAVRFTPRWSTILGVWGDFPNRGSNRYYGSIGLRCAILPR